MKGRARGSGLVSFPDPRPHPRISHVDAHQLALASRLAQSLVLVADLAACTYNCRRQVDIRGPATCTSPLSFHPVALVCAPESTSPIPLLSSQPAPSTRSQLYGCARALECTGSGRTNHTSNQVHVTCSEWSQYMYMYMYIHIQWPMVPTTAVLMKPINFILHNSHEDSCLNWMLQVTCVAIAK